MQSWEDKSSRPTSKEKEIIKKDYYNVLGDFHHNKRNFDIYMVHTGAILLGIRLELFTRG
jgi:hypothetical protein